MFTREMMKALEADGEKLRQLTGEDHGPVFVGLDPASGDDYTALTCACGWAHFRRNDSLPTECANCGSKFEYSDK